MRVEGWCIIAATAFAIAFGNLDNLPAHGQCNYEISAIITPDDAAACWPFPPSNTFAQGMNSKGEVVGYYVPCAIGNEQAFYWSAETGFVTLPKPPTAVQAFATGINDHGIIIGRHTFSGVGGKGFVYDPKTGAFTYLEPLHPGVSATTVSAASAINGSNAVAGSRVISEPGVTPVISNAVVWHPYGVNGDGRQVVIDFVDSAGPNSRAHRISESGQSILGTSGSLANPIGFVYEPPDDPFLVDESFGMSSSTVLGIIGDGHYGGTGAFIQRGLVRAFIMKDTKITDLIEPLAGYSHSASIGANALGEILVHSQVPGDKPGIWQNGVHTALDDVTEPVANLALTLPRSINNGGQIVTRATFGSKIVGVLLTPVDRPLTDLNGDCVTDVHDLMILLNSWGICKTSFCPADLSASGSVGVPDLLFLLSNWG